jgi:hypothetical protein
MTTRYLNGGTGVHDTASVGHFILIGVLGVVVIVHGMNNAQIEEQAILENN